MFRFIERQKNADHLVHMNQISLDDIAVLRSKELNLFPAFGDIKILTERERKDKNIQNKVQALSSELEKVKEQSESCKVSDIKKEYIREAVNEINDNLRQFDRAIKAVGRKAASKQEPNYKIDPTSEKFLKSCNEYLKKVSQYISDLNTISAFAINDIQISIDPISQMIRTLGEEIQSMGL